MIGTNLSSFPYRAANVEVKCIKSIYYTLPAEKPCDQ